MSQEWDGTHSKPRVITCAAVTNLSSVVLVWVIVNVRFIDMVW